LKPLVMLSPLMVRPPPSVMADWRSAATLCLAGGHKDVIDDLMLSPESRVPTDVARNRVVKRASHAVWTSLHARR